MAENDRHAEYHSLKHIPNLDGLRCLSIVCVIAYHSGVCTWGHHGVTLFFAISGFIITTLLLREKSRNGGISLGKFYARRALRIFPLYYAVFVFYTFVILRSERATPDGQEFVDNIPYFVTYTANWAVRPGARFYLAWSLATEEQFYLFWPFIIALSKSRRVPILTMIGLLVFELTIRSLVAVNLLGPGPGGVMGVATSVAPAICLGALLAYALDDRRSFVLFERVFCTWPCVLAIGAVSALLLWQDTRVPRIAIETFAALIVAAAVCNRTSRIASVLNRASLAYVGTISYGMYLTNLIAINIANSVLHVSGWALFATATFGTLAIATVSFYSFEKLFRMLRLRFEVRT